MESTTITPSADESSTNEIEVRWVNPEGDRAQYRLECLCVGNAAACNNSVQNVTTTGNAGNTTTATCTHLTPGFSYNISVTAEKPGWTSVTTTADRQTKTGTGIFEIGFTQKL